MWHSIFRDPYPHTRQEQLRLARNNFFLHLHPPQVAARALHFTYTWGLGGLSALLALILTITGVLLMFHYTPTPGQAYDDIVGLSSYVPFGQLLRNLHRWAGDAMIVVAFLHMARVFFTGGYKSPRQFNWLVGLSLLLLTVALNFTGYLLP